MTWLGCSLTNTGSGTARIHHRCNLAIGALKLLVQNYDFKRLRLSIKARFYKSITESVLIHGCNGFPINISEFQHIDKTMNLIQRTFLKSALPDARDRWIDLLRRLVDLRQQQRLSDTVERVRSSFKESQYTQATKALYSYRGTTWKETSFHHKARRRCGKPPVTLAALDLASTPSHE